MTQPFQELLRTGRLPSPSGVGARILTLTQDADATVDDIADALARDPALTGRILGVANSALNAGNVPLASAKAAAMRLGLKAAGRAEGRTAFDDIPAPTRPLYTGHPWFLALAVLHGFFSGDRQPLTGFPDSHRTHREVLPNFG